jgi:hypothetical protein
MLEMIQDAVSKGLIDIVRRPRSEELVEILRTNSNIASSDCWHWVDWARFNRN